MSDRSDLILALVEARESIWQTNRLSHHDEPEDLVERGAMLALDTLRTTLAKMAVESGQPTDVEERAAAVIQCRTSWPQAEALARDLAQAGLLREPS